MPSFDAVSEVDMHELANAVDQVRRDIATRYDFKGTSAALEQSDSELTLIGDSEFQVGQIMEILLQKAAKRGIDVGALDLGAVEESGGKARQKVTVRQGIDAEAAKKLVRTIKDAKMKVQAAIQGDSLRVTGKKKDDLQEAMAIMRTADVGLPLQFKNFRD